MKIIFLETQGRVLWNTGDGSLCSRSPTVDSWASGSPKLVQLTKFPKYGIIQVRGTRLKRSIPTPIAPQARSTR